jgi:hypothetical protein
MSLRSAARRQSIVQSSCTRLFHRLVLAVALFAVGFAVVVVTSVPAWSAGDPPATPPAATATSPATSRTAEQKRQDDINRVMEFFRLTQPDVYDQALALRGSDPGKFDKLIMGALPTVNRLEVLKRKSQKLFDLSIRDLQLGYQSLRLSHELKRADLAEADRRKLSDQLKGIVAEEFDVQQQIRQSEIDDLQSKIRDLNAQVKDRQNDKDAIIGKRVEDLIEHNPRLEW